MLLDPVTFDLVQRADRVIGVGEHVPDARVWADAGDRTGVSLTALAEEGPFLLLVYLFDFTST